MPECPNIPTIPKPFSSHRDAAWVWELWVAAAPQRGVGMARGREWKGFAHGMAPVARLVLAVSAETSPERTHACYLSGLPCHTEGTCKWGFDLSHMYSSSFQQSCVSRDSWRYLRSSMVLFRSSLLLITSTHLKRCPVPFSHGPDIHSMYTWGLLFSLLMQPATV